MNRITRALALVATFAFASVASAEVIFVVGTGNTLISFNHTTPAATLASRSITGLSMGENIVGIDFRPASGGLMALGSSNRLYRIDTATGAATVVGTVPFTPGLSGTEFGFDFNPTVDRIRLVSNTEQNLRFQPDTGVVAGTDTALSYATGDVAFGADPSIVGAAYTNSLATATSTILYVIDSTRNTLVRQGSINASPSSPNLGLLFTIGGLGVDTGDAVGFDISSASGIAFAALQIGSMTDLFTIDLSTGAATRIGTIAGTATVGGLAVQQDLVVSTLPVVGSAPGLNGTAFRTSVVLTNSSSIPATVTLDFYRSSATPVSTPPLTTSITLAANEQRILENVPSQFGLASGTGALRISSSRPVSVFARIFNDQRTVGRGSFGQIARGLEESDRRTTGVLVGLANQVSSDPTGARTNIGFFNPASTDSTVTLTIRDGAGTPPGTTLGTATRTIGAQAHQQFSLGELFPTVAAGDNYYVTYSATGALFGYASVIDNTSGDGSFIPSLRF